MSIKGIHPWDLIPQLPVGAAFRWMRDGRFWRRHPSPFSKTLRGAQRRRERRFVLNNRWGDAP